MSDKWQRRLVVLCLIFGVQAGRAMAEKLGREAIWDEWKGRYIAFLGGCAFFAIVIGVFGGLFLLIVIVAMAISALTVSTDRRSV